MLYGDPLNPAQAATLQDAKFKTDADLVQKVEILQKEFEIIDVNHDSVINRQELYSYLDRKSGVLFDREIADEIFERMDADANENVSIEEFIKVYIQAEEMLRRKIEAAKINKESYKRQKDDCLRKSQQEKQTEKMTAYGISQDSLVHITILEATGVFPRVQGLMGLSVEVSLDDRQKTRTKIAPSVQPGQTVAWDEKFKFDIINPDSYLKFTIFEAATQGMQSEVVVPLSELQDQNLHDVALDLFDSNGQKARGQLHVKLQWVHSKSKYFAMVAQKWLENFHKEEDELAEYERYLETLYKPFPGLQAIYSITQYNQPHRIVAGLTDYDHKYFNMMDKAATMMGKENTEGFWARLTTFVCLVEIVMAILISFLRPVFIDLVYPVLILIYLRTALVRDIMTLKMIALGIFLSVLFLDLPWMWLFSTKWTDVNTTGAIANLNSRRLIILFSFINMGIKVVLSFICYMLDLFVVRTRGNYRSTAKNMQLSQVSTSHPTGPGYYSGGAAGQYQQYP